MEQRFPFLLSCRTLICMSTESCSKTSPKTASFGSENPKGWTNLPLDLLSTCLATEVEVTTWKLLSFRVTWEDQYHVCALSTELSHKYNIEMASIQSKKNWSITHYISLTDKIMTLLLYFCYSAASKSSTTTHLFFKNVFNMRRNRKRDNRKNSLLTIDS